MNRCENNFRLNQYEDDGRDDLTPPGELKGLTLGLVLGNDACRIIDGLMREQLRLNECVHDGKDDVTPAGVLEGVTIGLVQGNEACPAIL